jgi:hypothetical protein
MTRGLLLALAVLAAPARAGRLEEAQLQAREAVAEALKAAPISGKAPPAAAARALPFEPSVDAALRRQLEADFDFLGSLQGADATPLHRQVYGPLEGTAYLRWFDARVHSIGSRVCGPPAAVACVAPFLSEHTMWIAPTYSTFNLPQIYRLLVVLHEARHTERAHAYYGHVNCPENDLEGRPLTGIFSGVPLGGKPGCDRTALGAYGAGLLFIKNVGEHCANCTGKVRMDAGFYADDTLKRIVDRPAYDALRADLYR